MPRYVTRANKPLYVETPLWDGEPLMPSLTVDDTKETNTGLVDERGHAIYRLQGPIGFGRHDTRKG